MKTLSSSDLTSICGGGVGDGSTAAYDVAYVLGSVAGFLGGLFKEYVNAPNYSNWHSGMMGVQSQ